MANQEAVHYLINIINGPVHLWFLKMLLGLYVIIPLLKEFVVKRSLELYFIFLSLITTFILPMVIGACVTMQGENSVLDFAFGVVAMVAMTPLITIQSLGFKSVLSVRRRGKIAIRRIMEAGDDQIIYFE